MSNYTSGPLMYDGECRIDAVQFRAPSGFICEDGSEHMDGLIALPYACADGASEGNARRLVACWNACIGISTEELERAPKLMRAPLSDLAQQRDELLQALDELLSDVGRASSLPSAIKARAAIAKALGEVEQAEQIAEAA